MSRATAPVGFSELAEELQIPKSTLHGFIKGLLAEGYLEAVGNSYSLGAGLHAILGPADTSSRLLLDGLCEQISARTGETVTTAVPVASSVVYVFSAAASYEVCYMPRLRVRRPLLPTSSGKVFLAFADPQKRTEIYDDIDAHLVRAFEAERAEIERTGMAYNKGETVKDVGAVAVGAWINGHLSAAITVAGPISRISDDLPYYGAVALEVVTAAGFGSLTEG
ncbi:IclR family transcriptional regulator [Brevibacterium luteolum]|uniref:IclR family transcriptional regulator n=1 Tax=Brevibacterium luteolum TaxID=199591 RepID=UPI001CA5A244|nr:IclR family transcriptional regulator C-terminal domain-containing protein [Brevibacterium luteolum]